jgi:flagellar basal-body rod modification protein FlgD
MSGITSTSGITAASAASNPDSILTSTGTNALASLSGNFSDFLNLLLTQLQNQDPSSPTDSTQFTSELVQFAQVEQQIDTNQDLTQEINLTQASQVEQSSSFLGKAVTISGDQLSLQNSNAEITFNTSSPEAVGITVFNASGVALTSQTVNTTAGTNTWTWNGAGPNGVTEPDGAYTVSVTQIGQVGTGAAVPFNVIGTATAVQNLNGTVDLQLGGLTVPFSQVVQVGS